MDEQALKQQMKLLKRQHQEVMWMLDRHLQELESSTARRYTVSIFPFNMLEKAMSRTITALEYTVGWLADNTVALLSRPQKR